MLIKAKTPLLFLCVVLFVLIESSLFLTPEPAAAQAGSELYFSSDEKKLNRFELYKYGGAYWWVNGSCQSVEDLPPNFSPQSLQPVQGVPLHLTYKSISISFANEAISPLCGGASGLIDVVRDDQFFYYLREGGLRYKAVGQTTARAFSVMSSYYPKTLDLRGDNLYFSQGNTVYRLKKDGSQAPVVVASAHTTITWMKSISLRNGALVYDNALLWVAGGSLYRWREGDGIHKLADGPIHDVSVDYTGSVLNSNQRTYVFAALDEGVFQINAETGSYDRLYDGVVHSVTTDTTISQTEAYKKNIYISFDVETCVLPPDGLQICTYNPIVYRHRLVSNDFSNDSWEPIASELNGGGGHNLRSDGTWLYFRTGEHDSVGEEIRRIRTDVDPIEINITADYLEVVQAIQSLNTDVTLVADKATFARGYAYLNNGNITAAGAFMSARLYGNLDGQDLGYVDSFADAWITFNKDISDRRSNITSSFLFKLPNDWVQTTKYNQSSTLKLTMVVDPDGMLPETGANAEADNTVSLINDAKIVHRDRPCIITIPVYAQGAPPPSGSPDIMPFVISRARILLPVEDFKVIPVYKMVANKLNMSAEEAAALADNLYLSDDGAPYNLTEDDDSARSALGWAAMLNFPPPSYCQEAFYVGLIHKDATWKNDLNNEKGGLGGSEIMLVKLRENGKSWEWPNGGGILAHEIGHNYDREHIKCGNFPESQQNFNFLPFDNCRLSYEDDDALFTHYGFDPISFGQAKSAIITPDAAADVMSYHGDKWITAFFWEAVLKEVIKIPIPSTMEDMVNAEDFLLVQGAIATDQTTAEFTRLAIVAADVAPEQQVTRSLAQQAAVASREPVSYTLTLADAAGQPLDTFTVVAEPSHEASADSPISFIQYVPWKSQAVRVQLRLAETLLADYPLSQNPPTVLIESLQIDDQAETVLLTWEMSDEDGDPLVATVQYSADGEVWQPLILETAATEVTVPTELLAGSDSGRLRVIVNDGAYTAVAISEPFAVPNHPPIVQFDGVQEGARLAYNQSLIFYGMAFDVEDGHIDSDALLWFLSGPITRLGVGSDFSVDKLPQGEYSLMASVLDSDDVRGEQVVHFEVLAPEVPEVSTPYLDGYCGDDDYLDALVIAADDGEKTVPVYLLHAGEALYVCFNRMTLSDNLFVIQYAGIKLDLNASGDEGLQTGDRGFFINSHGELFQTKRAFSSLVVTEEPDFGYRGSIKRGSDSWSAEIRIDDELLEGWDHAVRMALHLNTNSATSTANPWPETAVDENAAHWAPAYFGSAPAAENRPPTADAGDMIIHQFAAAQTVYLDGQSSYDSDGDTLTYSWSQVDGPTVELQNATTPLLSFEAQPVTEMQELNFTLTVSDGSLESDSAQVTVILLPPAPKPTSSKRQLYLPFVIR